MSDCQADLVNTKECLLSDCGKPYHKIKENLPYWEELEHLLNYALSLKAARRVASRPIYIQFVAQHLFPVTIIEVGCALKSVFIFTNKDIYKYILTCKN